LNIRAKWPYAPSLDLDVYRLLLLLLLFTFTILPLPCQFIRLHYPSLAGGIFGTWDGALFHFHWSRTLVDTDLRLAVSRGSVWSVVYGCATHVRVQRGDAPWNIPKILRTVFYLLHFGSLRYANAEVKFGTPS